MASSAANANIMTAIDGIRRSGVGSDLTIVCEGEEFKVHKFLLVEQSDYFRAALTGHFQEASGIKIMIDEQDPEILDAVLDFMYGRPYGVPQGWERLVFHSKMYSAAFYFQLPTLRKTAFGFFESAMSSWRIDERSAIINAARCIYQTPTYTHIAAKTDRGLHDTVSQWFAFNVTEFFGDKKKDMDTELLQLFGDVPALALDIFKHRGSSMFVDVCMKCGVCDGEFGIVKGSSKHNSDIRVRCPFCKVRETQKYVSALEKILMDDRRRRRGEVVEDDGNMSAQSSG